MVVLVSATILRRKISAVRNRLDGKKNYCGDVIGALAWLFVMSVKAYNC
jgi:hypothetical protein